MPTKLESLYELDNVLTITVDMPADDWTKLRQAEPKFGFKEEEVDPPEWRHQAPKTREEVSKGRYDWLKAKSVTIKGTKFPTAAQTFTEVNIIKKSFAGSKDDRKPSIRLDFSKSADLGKLAEDSLGVKSLTLNNSKQDDSYVRQTIGYDIFRQAGLPYPLCNYAKLIVNGEDCGAYINLEPFKKAFVERNFSTDKGNLYEIELWQDLTEKKTAATKGGISFEGFSKHDKLADLQKAAAQLGNAKTIVAANQVVDMDNFIRYYALEILLKHWDGYANKPNNTYIYNDVPAVQNPDPAKGDIKIKFIASGIDQILQQGSNLEPYRAGVVAALVLGDTAGVKKLKETISKFSDTIFSQKNLDEKIFPLIKKMEDIVNKAAKKPDAPNVTGHVDSVRQQLGAIRSAASGIRL